MDESVLSHQLLADRDLRDMVVSMATEYVSFSLFYISLGGGAGDGTGNHQVSVLWLISHFLIYVLIFLPILYGLHGCTYSRV